MASPSSLRLLLTFLCFSFFIFASKSQSAASRPNNLVLPLRKDAATNLHVATIYKRTPQIPLKFVVDLNGGSLWVNCDQNYVSSTYQAPQCRSTQCVRANALNCFQCNSPQRPGCHKNTCGLMAVNPVNNQRAMSELGQDILSIRTISGSQSGPAVTVPRYLFACAPSRLIQSGLPNYVHGVVGLGHSSISLPAQLGAHFGFRPNFALCLTSSTNNNGAILFGGGPFNIVPGVGASSSLGYTPLTISKQGEYNFQVRAIKINRQNVPISDPSLLTLSRGGAVISTTTPFTALQHSLYQTFSNFFVIQLRNIPRVPPVAPFGLCYDQSHIQQTSNGPNVPNIDLVLGNQNSVWTISGSNVMVQARQGVWCLAFVDGGVNPRASIVVGAHQLQDNLVHFDVARSSVGFRRANCANFASSTTGTTTTP